MESFPPKYTTGQSEEMSKVCVVSISSLFIQEVKIHFVLKLAKELTLSFSLSLNWTT